MTDRYRSLPRTARCGDIIRVGGAIQWVCIAPRNHIPTEHYRINAASLEPDKE